MRFLNFTVILFTALFLFAKNAAAQQQSFCFEMKIGNSTKRLTLNLKGDEWKTGWVQYAGQSGTIPIRKKKETVLASPESRPSDIRYDYEEVQNGKATGQYTFTLQGAAFGYAYYKRYRDSKKFAMNRPDSADEDCLK